MHEQIESIKRTRAYLLETIKDLTTEQLNTIPPHFNNNIIWNLGHMIAAQQGICYVRAGMQPKVADAFIAAYRPGTKPEAPVDEAAIGAVKTLLLTTPDQLAQDYNSGLWLQYPSWTTRYGVELNSIEAAVSFLLYHEGLHAGYIMAQKRLVAHRATTV